MQIGLVERETGVSRDVLRMWERRYQFPLPKRDRLGDRVYSRAQVERLRLIKRLMDGGHRAGAVVGLARPKLLAMLRKGDARADGGTRTLARDSLLAMVSDGRMATLRTSLERSLLKMGLAEFLNVVLAPLNAAVGRAWEVGSLPIHMEHLYSEMAQALLRDAIAKLPTPRRRPRVLLTTLPGEQHSFGLLMLGALCRSSTVETVSLGTQTPIEEIAQAAQFHSADVVALSFSSAFSPHLIQRDVRQLRQLLPDSVELWIGGAGVARLRRRIPGTRSGCTLKEAGELLRICTTERSTRPC